MTIANVLIFLISQVMHQRENTEMSEGDLVDSICITWNQDVFQSLFSSDFDLVYS